MMIRVSDVTTSSPVVLTITVLSSLDEMSSNSSTGHGKQICRWSQPVKGFIESSAVQSAYIPGTIAMEERYINLLIVMGEATAMFPNTPTIKQ